jgi:hypothetical protein
MNKSRYPLFALVLAAALAPSAAMASTVTFGLDQYLTAGQFNGQTTAIATVSITDTGIANQVKVTLTPNMASDPGGPQTITGLWLNLGPSGIGPAAVSIAQDASATYNPFVSFTYQPVASQANGNAFDSTGANFNLMVKFDNSVAANDITYNRAGAPEVFTITATTGSLTALMFNNVDVPNSGNGKLATALAGISLTNYTGVAGAGVGYVASVVPLPAALPLLLSGLAGLGVMKRRRKLAAV